jgi:hypothetical protein
MAGRGRRYRGARGHYDISDEHEHEAMWTLRRRYHGRVARLFLKMVGWSVAPPSIGVQVRHVNPSHEHSVHHEDAHHLLDRACELCRARHRTDQPPR